MTPEAPHSPEPPLKPLIVLLGPTASGKTALSLALARHFHAEILSCDSVAVYRGMQLGTAKPSAAERAEIPHHCLDLYDPSEPCTAGDYARAARQALAQISTLPVVSGGTGLYLRALLDGLFPSPPPSPALRALLRTRAETRGPHHLHRSLQRFDPTAAARIHPNDASKVIRAIEVTLAARTPITAQWTAGRDALTGYRILRIGLHPPRELLYTRIDHRAQSMFALGLVEETRTLIARFGPACRPFTSLGYAEASAVLRGTLTEPQAIAEAQQGHRNFAKRQLTWFRREAQLHPVHWLHQPGDTPQAQTEAIALVTSFLARP